MTATVDERTPLINSRDQTEAVVPHPDAETGYSTAVLKGQDEDDSKNEQPNFSVIAVLLLGVFVGDVDGTLVIAQTGAIASEFNDLAKAEWLVASYYLASCASQTIIGKLSDIYGRKPMLLISYLFFALGNLLSGAGQEMWQVLLGRAIAGIGGGAGITLVSVLIADLVPPRSVAAWRSIINVAATTGRSCGGPIGGALTDTVGWRWSFWGQVPLTIIAFLLVLIKLPARQEEQYLSAKKVPETQLEKLRRIDFLGAFALIVTTLTFLLGLELGSRSTSWLSPITVTLLTGSAISAAIFVLIESKFAKEPVFPVHLMRNTDVITNYLIGLFQTIAQIELMFNIPLYFQITMNASASDAGTRLVPAVLGNTVGGLVCGVLIKRTGRYKLLTVGGLLFACIGYTLIIARWHGATNWAETFYTFPGGFGNGVIQSTTFVALTAQVSRADFAAAGSGLYQVIGIGGSIGSCVTMMILQATLRPMLTESLKGMEGKEQIISRAMEDMHYVQSLRGSLQEIVVGAYVKALNWAHVSSLCFSLVALVVCLFMKERRI